MYRLIRNFPFSLMVTAVIWYLSFCSVPETPMEDVPFIDKWVHVCMYGCLSGTIWLEYIRSYRPFVWQKIMWGGLILPIVMSGIIELGQAYCTNGRRSGDWLDFAANALGAVLASLVGYFILRKCIRPKRDI